MSVYICILSCVHFFSVSIFFNLIFPYFCLPVFLTIQTSFVSFFSISIFCLKPLKSCRGVEDDVKLGNEFNFFYKFSFFVSKWIGLKECADQADSCCPISFNQIMKHIFISKFRSLLFLHAIFLNLNSVLKI